MAKDALERLNNSNNAEESNYSLDEQLDSARDDDFLDGMSDDSRNALMKATEITLDDEDNEDEEIKLDEPESDNEVVFGNPIMAQITQNNDKTEENQPQNKALFNSNTEKKKRGRQKKVTTETKSMSTSDVTYDPILNQLAKDIIDDLKKSKYTISRFGNEQMNLILNYMYEKF